MVDLLGTEFLISTLIEAGSIEFIREKLGLCAVVATLLHHLASGRVCSAVRCQASSCEDTGGVSHYGSEDTTPAASRAFPSPFRL